MLSLHRRVLVPMAALVALLAPRTAHATPTTPSTLVATTVSSSAIQLTWHDADSVVGGFSIERSLKSGNGFSVIAVTSGTVRSYQDNGLGTGITYYYRLRAFTGNDYSRRSNIAAARTTPVADTTPPSVPTGLTATASGCSQINLQWNAVTDTGSSGLRGYRVYRNSVRLVEVATPSTAVDDVNLPALTSYTYTVSSVDNAGNESGVGAGAAARTAACAVAATPTRTVTPLPATATPKRTSTPLPATATPKPTATAVPDQIPPSAPTSLSVAAASCTQLTLIWSGSTDTGGSGLRAYNIYRGGTLVKVVAAPATSTGDTGLAGGTAYTYVVRAIDNANNLSGSSNSATANTPACNQAPIANAGPDVTATRNVAVTLNGSGSSDPDGSLTSYAWTFGDGASGSGATVAHAYATAGTFTATLTVTDNAGATAIDRATVTVNDTSTASGQPVWSEDRGGAGADVTRGVAVDSAGNTLVVGNFTGATNFGSGTLSSAGSGDVILGKYNSAGTPVWAKRFGGTGNDTAYAVAVDRSANCDNVGGTNCIVVAGNFAASADFGSGALTSAGGADIFVAKYSSAGAALWTRRYGGTSDDSAYGVAVDASGNVVVTGYFTGSADFGGGTLYSPFFDEDAFVLKLSRSGGYLWARNFSNTSRDIAQAVALTAGGDAVVAGWNLGAFEGLQSRGKEDIFVVRLASATGAEVWAQRFGGTSTDQAFGVAVDGADNVAVTGTIQGPVDFGGGTLTPTGGDIFLLELTSGGAYRWAKHFGGTYDFVNCGMAVATDASSNILVSGIFEGNADFGTGVFASVSGTSDAFLAKYTAGGAALWAKHFGTSGTEYATDVAVDPTQNGVVVTGAFNGLVDLGTGSLTTAGSYDAFLGRFSQ